MVYEVTLNGAVENNVVLCCTGLSIPTRKTSNKYVELASILQYQSLAEIGDFGPD